LCGNFVEVQKKGRTLRKEEIREDEKKIVRWAVSCQTLNFGDINDIFTIITIIFSS